MKPKKKPYHRILPSCLVFGMLVIAYLLLLRFLHYPEVTQCQRPAALTAISDFDKDSLLTYTFDTLTYTGIDYLRDGAVVGGYYYAALDTEQAPYYILVLVRTAQPKTVLTDYTCRLRLLGREYTAGILSLLSDNSSIAYTSLEPLFFPSILSEPDYPSAHILFIHISIYVIRFLLLLCFASFIRTTIKTLSDTP